MAKARMRKLFLLLNCIDEFEKIGAGDNSGAVSRFLTSSKDFQERLIPHYNFLIK